MHIALRKFFVRRFLYEIFLSFLCKKSFGFYGDRKNILQKPCIFQTCLVILRSLILRTLTYYNSHISLLTPQFK